MVGLLLRRIGCTTVSWEAENAIGSLGSRGSLSSLDSRGIRVSSETREHRQFTGNQPRVFCGRRGRASGRAPFIRRCHRRIISPAARCVGLATKPNIGRPAETNTWLACVINTPRNDFEKIEASAVAGAAGSRARTIYGRRRNLKNDRSVARQVR